MTLLAGFTNSFTSILVADSRLTWQDQRDPSRMVFRDVCQKVARLGTEGLVAFSGDVRTAHRVVLGITGTFQKRGLGWLKEEDEVNGLFEYLGIRPTDPTACFLVTFIDKEHEVLPGVPGAVLIEFGTNARGTHKVTYFGLSFLGSGSVISAQVRKDPGLIGFLNFSGANNQPITVAQRSLFFAEVMAISAMEMGVETVGGLFQIHFVLPSGVFALPYERWVDLDVDVGTYVRMDIDSEGYWIQRHEPSGLELRLGFPYNDDFTLRDGAINRTFDMRDRLTRDSQGVIHKSNPQELYRPIGGSDWIVRTP